MKHFFPVTVALFLSGGVLLAQQSQHVDIISFPDHSIDVHSSPNSGARSGLNGEHGGQAGSNAGQQAAQPAPSPLDVVAANLAALAVRVAKIKEEQNQLLEQRDWYASQGLAQEWNNKMEELKGELGLVRDDQVREMSIQRDLIQQRDRAIDAARRAEAERQEAARQATQHQLATEHRCARC